jgi:hypothetical protein
LLLDIGHDLFACHIFVIDLSRIFSFVAISPLFVIIVIKHVKFPNQFVRSNFDGGVTLILFLTFLALLLFRFLIFFLFLVSGSVIGSCGTGGLLFRSEGRLFVETGVEFLKVIGDFTEKSFLFLNPLTTLISHLVLNVVAFNRENLLLKLNTLFIKLLLVLDLSLFGNFHLFVFGDQWVSS